MEETKNKESGLDAIQRNLSKTIDEEILRHNDEHRIISSINSGKTAEMLKMIDDEIQRLNSRRSALKFILHSQYGLSDELQIDEESKKSQNEILTEYYKIRHDIVELRQTKQAIKERNLEGISRDLTISGKRVAIVGSDNLHSHAIASHIASMSTSSKPTIIAANTEDNLQPKGFLSDSIREDICKTYEFKNYRMHDIDFEYNEKIDNAPNRALHRQERKNIVKKTKSKRRQTKQAKRKNRKK